MQSQVPPAAARYFGVDSYGFRGLDRDHPIIVQEFTPERGWKIYPLRKRVSRSWLRKIRAEGVTHVMLRSGGRSADFSIAELLKEG
jgi:hypothetical protein